MYVLSLLFQTLTDQDIKLHHMYAAKPQDNWVRVQTMAMTGPGQYAVYLPDLGEYNFCEISHISPLPWKFWTLPYQSFKGRLEGKS